MMYAVGATVRTLLWSIGVVGKRAHGRGKASRICTRSQTNVPVGPILVQIRALNRAKCRQSQPNLGRARANFGRFQAEFVRLRSKVVRRVTKGCGFAPSLDRVRPNLGWYQRALAKPESGRSAHLGHGKASARKDACGGLAHA